MKQIALSGKRGTGKFALVDDADFEYLNQFKWFLTEKGYAVRNSIHGRSLIRMHREINNTPSGLETDHIDTNKLNNQRYNLRNATNSKNGMNRVSYKGSSSIFKGVCWIKKDKRWQAQILHEGKYRYLGYFKSEQDAALAYNFAAVKYFGEFARLNKAV